MNQERKEPLYFQGHDIHAEPLNGAMLFNHTRAPDQKTHAITFTYIKKEGVMPETRRLVPYSAKNGTHIEGFDLDKEAYRAFIVSRMSNVEVIK